MTIIYMFMIAGSVGVAAYVWGEGISRVIQRGIVWLRGVGEKIGEKRKEARRQMQIKEELAPAILVMTNALKAGLPLHAAFEQMACVTMSAIAPECERVVIDLRSGCSMEKALDGFKERIPLDEVVIWIDAIQSVRATGGNLVAILTSIRRTLMAHDQLRRRIRLYTAYGRYQLKVMMAIPIVTCGGFGLFFPDYMKPMIDHPVGWVMILVSMGLWVLGGCVIKQMINVEV